MNQTERYITLKPISERFNKIANSITDDEIRSLIKNELKSQLKYANFVNEVEEIVTDYLESNKEEIIDMFKEELKNKLR